MANRGVNLDPHILTIRDLEAAANKKLTKPIRGRICRSINSVIATRAKTVPFLYAIVMGPVRVMRQIAMRL